MTVGADFDLDTSVRATYAAPLSDVPLPGQWRVVVVVTENGLGVVFDYGDDVPRGQFGADATYVVSVHTPATTSGTDWAKARGPREDRSRPALRHPGSPATSPSRARCLRAVGPWSARQDGSASVSSLKFPTAT